MMRTKIAATLLTALPLAGLTAAEAGAATRSMAPCDGAYTTAVGNGWHIQTPAIHDRFPPAGVRCNLKLGDRYGDWEVYRGVLVLQRNLNSCYRTHLALDGVYGPKTRDAVRRVQALHHITADGIYGPQTRSAMYWRMTNGRIGKVSEKCYSPF